jgi:superfamily II RNA helicase
VKPTKDEIGPLYRRLPPPGEASEDEILNRFLEFVADQGLTLYAAQEEALLEIVAGKNLILNTPTGSGKSLVALAAHFAALAGGRRSFYTCPIKALVSEKFFALCKDFGPDQVGMITGDAAVNKDAPIICCTAEILANMALREGAQADVDCVIMDEFHYYSDRDRGAAWQIPLLALPQATYVLMSATLGDMSIFQERLTRLNGRETAFVRSLDRPVPLDFEYRETPLHETVAELIRYKRYPVYIVNFTQRACAEEAQNLMSMDYCTREEKRAIIEALSGRRFDSPYGKEVQKFVKHGIGLHHAGLLPKYRLLVEKLAQKGLLKIICGTDTLGVGVNIPIRTVLFTKLCKFDGEKTALLSVRDFQQISGRAGRKGFDDRGSVVAQAPEHVIENLRLEAKVQADPSKKKKLVRRKPPDKGYVHWDKATFERLRTSLPEPLVSRFQVSHGMLLNVLQRPRGGCKAMVKLIRDCHDTPAQKREHKKTTVMLFHSLVGAKVIEIVPREIGADGVGVGSRVRVHLDLQDDFSLNQTLSLYLLDTLGKLDMWSPTYALDLLTVVEAILENPDLILMKQLDKLKGRVVAELKAQGVEYEDRMEELSKLEHPKPNREFIYETFNAFAALHPWVGENIRPKSIAREMFETGQSFAEYIKEYSLERGEGVLLRYLSDVYKVLVQTVPLAVKTEEVHDIVEYFWAIVRGVDSSLLDEWEKMRDPDRLLREQVFGERAQEPEALDVTRNTRGFTILVRNAMFQIMRALASRDYVDAAELVSEGSQPWTSQEIEAAMHGYYEEHTSIRTDPVARAPGNTIMKDEGSGAPAGVWEVTQVICDPEGDNDWMLDCVIDLDKSRAAEKPVVTLRRIAS